MHGGGKDRAHVGQRNQAVHPDLRPDIGLFDIAPRARGPWEPRTPHRGGEGLEEGRVGLELMRVGRQAPLHNADTGGQRVHSASNPPA